VVPLLFNFHGYTSNAAQQQLYGTFMAIADTANFIIAHPEGSSPLGSQFWNTGIIDAPDDVKFTDDMINYLQSKYSIDQQRIYSCGMSNGGIMSYYLACNLPNRITAIASVTGSMFNQWFATCNPGRAMPVMEIHGTIDNVVPYAGNANFTPIDSVIKKWVQHNNCNSSATYTVPNNNSNDNSTALNYRYTGGTAGSSVELYKVIGGGHSWPGSFPLFANTNQDFNASIEIWRFFRQFKLNQFVVAAGIETKTWQKELRIMPNPTSDKLRIEGVSGATYTVYSLDGKKLLFVQQSDEVNVSALDKGIYFLGVQKDNRSQVIKFIRN
jgi:polyhydroxybutyrate depolymerase